MTQAAFSALHAAMRAQVDQQFLSGVSTVLLRGREVVDRFVYGKADIEAGTDLRDDHIYRVFSNSKLMTSCAIMLLVEDGKLKLDDPIERYIPELGQRKVLRAGATSVDDVEPARRSITVEHLMTHTSGLSYGAFDPGSVLFNAYQAAQVNLSTNTPAEFLKRLSAMPLRFHPGESWEYSVATDVLGHLVEIVSGQSLEAFFQQRICQPLGMSDTSFWVPEDKRSRFTALYAGDLMDPSKPGLVRIDQVPLPGDYTNPNLRQSGGGGLVSTMGDWTRLIQSLIPGGPTLLKPESLKRMMQNRLATGVHVQFPGMSLVPPNPDLVFGLGSSVLRKPSAVDPQAATDEFSWGGLAGTIWWINPRLNIAGILMTQRYFGFGNPYTYEFKRLAYQGLGHGQAQQPSTTGAVL